MASKSTASARGYLTQQAGQAHPDFDTSLQVYNALQDQFEPATSEASLNALAAKHTDQFLEVMRAVIKNAPKGSIPADFDLHRAHNWAQVRLEAGLKAEETYHNRAKGWKGFFPRIGRKIGEMNPAIDAVAQTLPAGDYTSVVCGSIVLFFKAFARMHEVREKILNTLQDYPLQLEAVEFFLKLYPQDHRLHKDAVQLYISLLVVIEAMIEWLGHGLWDRVSVLMKQGLYGRKLEEKISQLELASNQLRKQADICDKEVTVEIVAIVKANAERLYQLADELRMQHRETLEAVDAATGEVRSGNLLLHDSIHQNSTDIKLLNSSQNSAFDNVNKQIELTKEDLKESIRSEVETSTNNLLRQLSNRHRDLDWQRKALELQYRELALQAQIQTMRIEMQQVQHMQQPLYPNEVLHHLGPWPQTARADVAEYINLARTMRAGPETSEKILRSSSFQSWFASSDSRLLFVLPYRLISKINHTSFVTASLVGAIEQLPPSVTLTHFCSRHVGQKDDATAANLMASLVAQLLIKYPFDLTRWTPVATKADHIEYLQLKDIQYLCSLFKHMISSLSYGAIFVLIDDMIVLEQSCTPETVRLVTRTLWQTVQSCKERDAVILKVLVMTPDAKGSIVSYVDKDDLILLDIGSECKDNSMQTQQQVQLLEYAQRKHEE